MVYATEDLLVSRQLITLRVQLYDEDGLSDDASAARSVREAKHVH